MNDFLQLVLAGSALGARYALVALGFVVIYRATGVINFAQGAFVALGAYLTYQFNVTWALPFAIAVLLAMFTSAAVGAGIERAVLRKVIGRPVFAVIMITVGLLFLIDQIITTIWGFQSLNLGDPWGVRTSAIGELVLSHRDMWTLALAAAVLGGFFLLFRFTGLGLAMRATALDQEAAMARGIDVRKVFAASWAIAAAVAALAGITIASGPAALNPGVGLIALAAFPAMILGGLDSPLGAVVGGLLIGITQTLTAGYQPEHAAWLGQNFHVVMPYAVMIVILMVRPFGLFGTKEVVRL
ncbi:MAG TPA: branched-chain amino acid ABC transporter permease [Acidimicrobiales bacterium]|nr:branched-chain amino acid ABC transporter permease [Acidimicrobiales bacterium]